MATDPFEESRRNMEDAQRKYREHMESARRTFESAAEQFRRRVAEERERLEVAMTEARERFEAHWNKMHQNRPGAPKPGRDPGTNPEPAPVRPTRPSGFTGGAAAPLDTDLA